jgi:hypothetical protein
MVGEKTACKHGEKGGHRSATLIANIEKQLHESDEEMFACGKDDKPQKLMVNVDVVFCVDSD